MKKIIPYILIIIGIFLTIFIGYKNTTSDKELKEDEIEENEIKEDNSNNEDNNKEELIDNNKEVEQYLIDKYSEKFEEIKLVKTFCVENSETNLFFSMPCTDKKIKNEIYQVKDSNNLTFYVKKVSYDESKIKLTRKEDINIQSVGLYDTYISENVAKKVEKQLQEKYKNTFENNNIKVEIYDGLGISNKKYNNFYMNLGKEFQHIKDKNINIDKYIETIEQTDDIEISIHIKIDEKLTKDNVQQIISKFEDDNNLSTTNNKIKLERILLEFNNDNRYIECWYALTSKFISIKHGKDIEDSFNEELYDKTIIIGDGFSSNGIEYEEFKKLDKTTFNF